MKLDIEQICRLAGDDLGDDLGDDREDERTRKRQRALATRRQWLNRRGVKPAGSAVREVKRGNQVMRCAVLTWDEKAVRDELGKVMPIGLAAASASTRRAVSRSSWDRTSKRVRDTLA